MTTSETRTGPGRARNKRGEGRLLRQEIVQAALELLDEAGDAQAVTLRAVARRAGISAPSIYSHFSDRQAVLLAALQRAFGELRQHLRGVVDRAGADAADRLLAMCRGYLDFARAQPRRYLVMFGGVWNAAQDMADQTADRAEVGALGMATLDDLTGYLRACAEDGRSASTDPATDATVLWVALHGLAHQRIVSTAYPWTAEMETKLITRLTYL